MCFYTEVVIIIIANIIAISTKSITGHSATTLLKWLLSNELMMINLDLFWSCSLIYEIYSKWDNC